MPEVPRHTSACQGTQESSKGQLPAAAPLTTYCKLIPQHLPAAPPGTLQLQRQCQEANQMQQVPLKAVDMQA